jgi:hypothetical protein
LCKSCVLSACKTPLNSIVVTLPCSWLFIFLLWLWSSSTFFLLAKLLQAMFIKLFIALQVSFSYFRLNNSSLFFLCAKSFKLYWCRSSLLLVLFYLFQLCNFCVLFVCKAP